MPTLVLGAVLIVIALIFGGVQFFHIFSRSAIYGSASNKWYYWGTMVFIGLIGIILVAWSLLRKQRTK